MNDETLRHLLDIKERLGQMEAHNDEMRAFMYRQLANENVLSTRVSAIEHEITRVKTSIRLGKWASGILIALATIWVKFARN